MSFPVFPAGPLFPVQKYLHSNSTLKASTGWPFLCLEDVDGHVPSSSSLRPFSIGDGVSLSDDQEFRVDFVMPLAPHPCPINSLLMNNGPSFSFPACPSSVNEDGKHGRARAHTHAHTLTHPPTFQKSQDSISKHFHN